MFSIKQINQTITEGNSLKFLAQSYSEIAAEKLRRIRRGIELNREFLMEIATVYSLVKLVATQRKFTKIPSDSPMLNTAAKVILRTKEDIAGVSPWRFILKRGTLILLPFSKSKKSMPAVPPIKKPPSTINILLTSNYRFYGNLELNLIEFFLKNSPRFQARSIVIGKIGLEFLKAMRFASFEGIAFKTDLPTASELKTLSEKIAPFQRVLVYHSKFQSVLNQTPFIKDIKEAQFEVSIPRRKIDYIFEPEIDKMIAFFDTEISSILLEQTFLESELARTAARLINMNNAEDNASELVEKQQRFLAQAQRSVYNIHLLNSLAGYFSRKKHHGNF